MSGLLQPTSGSNQPTPDFGRAFSERINIDRFVDGGHIKTHSYRRIRWNCLLAQGLLESWTAGCGFNDMDPVERHVSSYEPVNASQVVMDPVIGLLLSVQGVVLR